MEPIASSGAGAVFRPVGSGAGELSVLLREGRVLAGEVLANSGDGTLLLSIARHAVPAESDLRLDPGARFLVQVEQGADGIVLQLLDSAPDEEASLLRALRAAVGEERPMGELFNDLAHALRAELARTPSGARAPALAALAQGLEEQAARALGGGAALRALLGAAAQGHEATLAAVLAGRLGRDALGRVRDDWKSLLLRAHAELGQGPLGAAVARALSGLEAEQLLNLAREKAGEPQLFSFPFPDGEGWSTARLLVHERDAGSTEAGAEREPGQRVALALELSRLGPLRADFLLAPRTLSVRVVVTRAEVARALESELALLERRLSDGRRMVQLAVRVGTEAEIELAHAPLDIRYLREHRLLNVAG